MAMKLGRFVPYGYENVLCLMAMKLGHFCLMAMKLGLLETGN